jgi:ribokinase
MNTRLISVVGDDDNGVKIRHFLESEGVRTDLVDVRSRKKSSVVAVLMPDSGGSLAVAWKNEQALFLSADRLDDEDCKEALGSCDYLLATFELPSATVEAALLAAKDPSYKVSTTIVSPAPPYEGPRLDPRCHGQIDYLVANDWELNSFYRRALSASKPAKNVEASARQLILDYGVRGLFITGKKVCRAFTSDDKFSVNVSEMDLGRAGARAAFCAMFAKQLSSTNGGDVPDTRKAARWATTAMACAGRGVSVPESMPDLDRVAELVRGQLAVLSE